MAELDKVSILVLFFSSSTTNYILLLVLVVCTSTVNTQVKRNFLRVLSLVLSTESRLNLSICGTILSQLQVSIQYFIRVFKLYFLDFDLIVTGDDLDSPIPRKLTTCSCGRIHDSGDLSWSLCKNVFVDHYSGPAFIEFSLV